MCNYKMFHVLTQYVNQVVNFFMDKEAIISKGKYSNSYSNGKLEMFTSLLVMVVGKCLYFF